MYPRTRAYVGAPGQWVHFPAYLNPLVARLNPHILNSVYTVYHHIMEVSSHADCCDQPTRELPAKKSKLFTTIFALFTSRRRQVGLWTHPVLTIGTYRNESAWPCYGQSAPLYPQASADSRAINFWTPPFTTSTFLIWNRTTETQEDQNKEDEKARQKVKGQLIHSWMDRLQLVSVIVSIFMVLVSFTNELSEKYT